MAFCSYDFYSDQFLSRQAGTAFGGRLDVTGALRTQHNPASQCLHRSSVSRIGNAVAHGAASCEQSFFWKRLTDGAIIAKWWSVRFTCSTSKGPGVPHAIHRQE